MDGMSEASAMGILRVMPENISPLWPQLERLFAPAVAQVSTHTTEDVKRHLMAMRSQLWCDMAGATVRAALVTEFADYPVGMFIRIWLAGARHDYPMDNGRFHDVIDEWRQGHDAIGFEVVGRHGWLKHFPGLKVEGLIMRWVP